MVEHVVHAAWDVKARNVRVLDVRGIVSYTDYLVICHGTSDRHTQAIADQIVGQLRDAGVRPLGVEGGGSGEWILVDFVDVVVHVFQERVRREYGLESIYGDAPRVRQDAPPELEDPSEAGGPNR